MDAATGTITMTAPLELLQALEGPQGVGQRPAEVPAGPGDRIYGTAAFVQSNPFSFDDGVQSFLYPLDNSPAFDFLIPKTVATGGGDNDGGDGVGDDGDGRNGGDGVGDEGDGRTLPATGGQSLLTLLGLLTLGAGGWTVLRRRRR